MAERLWKDDQPTKDGASLGIYNKKEAEKAAEDHIKVTFDIGHLNTWKKYFKGSDQDGNVISLKDFKGKKLVIKLPSEGGLAGVRFFFAPGNRFRKKMGLFFR